MPFWRQPTPIRPHGQVTVRSLAQGYTSSVMAQQRRGPKGGKTTTTTGGLVHKKVLIRQDQAEALRRASFDERRSESEIVREALDDYFEGAS